jgi:formylmethanofuran dehydrogenase subunit E
VTEQPTDWKERHATVSRDGFEVPLIGIPVEATLETCDCCGETIGLSKSVFTGGQILCQKCNTP